MPIIASDKKEVSSLSELATVHELWLAQNADNKTEIERLVSALAVLKSHEGHLGNIQGQFIFGCSAARVTMHHRENRPLNQAFRGLGKRKRSDKKPCKQYTFVFLNKNGLEEGRDSIFISEDGAPESLCITRSVKIGIN